MKFDLSQFDTYGLDHKTVSGVLYIRPQWTKSGKRSKQWSNVKTKRGKAILDYATAGDVSQLYDDEPARALPKTLSGKSVIIKFLMETAQEKHSNDAFNP